MPDPLAEQVAAMQDIRDIRPPLSYGWDPRWRLALAALGLLAAALPVLYALRRRSRRPREAAAATAEPPHQVALAGLAALEGRLDEPDKRFYFDLSALLRTYLDARYGLDTREKTTEELLPLVRGLPEPADLRTVLAELLRGADPVKYADAALGLDRKRADLAAAGRFVRATGAPAGEARV